MLTLALVTAMPLAERSLIDRMTIGGYVVEHRVVSQAETVIYLMPLYMRAAASRRFSMIN
jgi:hypothetical protein